MADDRLELIASVKNLTSGPLRDIQRSMRAPTPISVQQLRVMVVVHSSVPSWLKGGIESPAGIVEKGAVRSKRRRGASDKLLGRARPVGKAA